MKKSREETPQTASSHALNQKEDSRAASLAGGGGREHRRAAHVKSTKKVKSSDSGKCRTPGLLRCRGGKKKGEVINRGAARDGAGALTSGGNYMLRTTEKGGQSSGKEKKRNKRVKKKLRGGCGFEWGTKKTSSADVRMAHKAQLKKARLARIFLI